MIFDSSVAVGHAEAVYLSARAREIPEDELPAVLGEAFGERGGARRFAPEELRGDGGPAALRGERDLLRGPRSAAAHPEHGTRHRPAASPPIRRADRGR